MAYWFLLRLARGVERVIQGEPDPQGVEIRAHATAYVKIIPPDVMFEAQRRLKREIAALDADGGPKLTPPKEPANGSEQRYVAISCELRRDCEARLRGERAVDRRGLSIVRVSAIAQLAGYLLVGAHATRLHVSQSLHDSADETAALGKLVVCGRG